LRRRRAGVCRQAHGNQANPRSHDSPNTLP
jgi:hypothetical protein